jgi:hypothetical protein
MRSEVVQNQLPGMGTRTMGLGAAVLAVFVAACSSGSLGDGPGAGGGGGGGTGGTSTGGTGLGGSGSGGDLQLPGCVASVVASCQPEGACTTGTNDAGETSSVCFAGEVKAVVTNVASALDCGGFITRATYTKPDGSPCFSFESYVDIGMACEGIRYTWKDAGGVVIATGLRNPYNTPTLTISCAGTAEGQACDSGAISGGPSNGCCNITGLGLPTCSYPQCVPGNCPVNN